MGKVGKKNLDVG